MGRSRKKFLPDPPFQESAEETEGFEETEALPLPPFEEEENEVLSNEHFLRLDESKLPIETFDSMEYEEKDKDPHEWLRLGKDLKTGEVHGFAAFYVNAGWKWRKCKVLSYDGTFQVREMLRVAF